jgi:hypothetical protein
MRSPNRFILAWKQGMTTVESMEVPRRDELSQQGAVQVVRFPDLAAKIESEWRAKGQHANPADWQLDQAVLHTDNETEFKYIVGVVDAIYQTKRDMRLGATMHKVPAFNVAFATD